MQGSFLPSWDQREIQPFDGPVLLVLHDGWVAQVHVPALMPIPAIKQNILGKIAHSTVCGINYNSCSLLPDWPVQTEGCITTEMHAIQLAERCTVCLQISLPLLKYGYLPYSFGRFEIPSSQPIKVKNYFSITVMLKMHTQTLKFYITQCSQSVISQYYNIPALSTQKLQIIYLVFIRV